MNQTTSSSSKTQPAPHPAKLPKWRRVLRIVVVTILVVFAAVVIALPYVVQQVMINTLDGQGADKVVIRDIDINLFTGKFAIQGLEISTQSYPPLTIETFMVRVPYWQALRNKITVRRILLRDALIPIVQLEDGSMVIGLPLPAATDEPNSEDQTQEKTEEPSSFDIKEWRVTLKKLLLKNVTVQLFSQSANSAFEIETFEIRNLTNQPEETSELTLLASISDLEKQSNIVIEANEISLETSQKLGFSNNSSAVEISLTGELSVDSSLLQYDNYIIGNQLKTTAVELTASYDQNLAEPLIWHISKFELGQLNTEFTDKNVEPAFSTELEIESLLVEQIGNQSPEEPATIALKGSIDRHSEISLVGTATPLTKKKSTDLKASIKTLELVPLAPYIEAAIGYHVESGQLNLDADIKAEQDLLDSNAGITLNNIKLTPASDEAAEKLTKQLTMPLDVMLSVLRDTDNNVHIDIPVRGDINNPDFNINDVVAQATAEAAQYAAVYVLKQMLQPYTTMISVAEFAYDQGTSLAALKLNPLIFQPDQVALDENQNDYLNKISELMQQRPELRIRFCGVGYTPIPVASDSDNQQSQASEQKEEKTNARTRAEQLAKLAKQTLIEKHDIGSDRLFSCRPTTEQAGAESTANARVDLLL
ncbi:MAG: DUF748 domain-containing protein [Pseudomonadales bacterium]|nr:DUF748 domain-containing protein [Pseudomonadales bacterium]